MLDFILQFIAPIIFFAFGYIYREIILVKDMLRITKNLDKKIVQEIKRNMVKEGDVTIKKIKKLKHEIIDGIHYFYAEKDNSFACQGITLDVAAENYSVVNGKDTLGYFQHPELQKEYCFINGQCVEVVDEQH